MSNVIKFEKKAKEILLSEQCRENILYLVTNSYGYDVPCPSALHKTMHAANKFIISDACAVCSEHINDEIKYTQINVDSFVNDVVEYIRKYFKIYVIRNIDPTKKIYIHQDGDWLLTDPTNCLTNSFEEINNVRERESVKGGFKRCGPFENENECESIELYDENYENENYENENNENENDCHSLEIYDEGEIYENDESDESGESGENKLSKPKLTQYVCFVYGGEIFKSNCVKVFSVEDCDVREYIRENLTKYYGNSVSARYVKCENAEATLALVLENAEKQQYVIDPNNKSILNCNVSNVSNLLKSAADVTNVHTIKLR